MAPKKDLSQEEIQEIKSLRGKMPASKVRKQFGIGVVRVQKIWAVETVAETETEAAETETEAAETAAETEAAETETETETAETELTEREESLVDDLRMLLRDSIGQETQVKSSLTIEEFHKLMRDSLNRLEIRTEKVSRVMVEIISTLKRGAKGNEAKTISENLGKSIGTFYTLLSDNLHYLESRAEQATDLLENAAAAIDGERVEPPHPSVVEQMVDTAERWVYLSLSVAIISGVFTNPRSAPRDTEGESSVSNHR